MNRRSFIKTASIASVAGAAAAMGGSAVASTIAMASEPAVLNDGTYTVVEDCFYGIKNEPYTLCITGGLNTDIQMHVCDENQDPISGLYGVGTVVGDMFGDIYDYRCPGINLGGCCDTFGYLLGKKLPNGEW